MKMKLYPVLDGNNKVCGFHWDYEFQYLDEVTYGDLVEVEIDDEQLKKALRKQLISSSILTYEEWKSRKLDEDIEDSEIE